MGEYKLVLILLFTLIIGSKTWPHTAREGTDNHQSKSTKQKGATSGYGGDGDITFPDDIAPGDIAPGRTDYSAEGKGLNCTQNICEDASDYPYGQIENIVSQLPDLPGVFKEYVGNYIDSASRAKPGEPDWNPLCGVKVRTSYPQAMPNTLNVTKYIINDKKTYKQTVIFTECVESATCAKEASFQLGIEARCTQKYSQVRLYAITKEGEAAPDTFLVPSCCVCEIKKSKA